MHMLKFRLVRLIIIRVQCWRFSNLGSQAWCFFNTHCQRQFPSNFNLKTLEKSWVKWSKETAEWFQPIVFNIRLNSIVHTKLSWSPRQYLLYKHQTWHGRNHIVSINQAKHHLNLLCPLNFFVGFSSFFFAKEWLNRLKPRWAMSRRGARAHHF